MGELIRAIARPGVASGLALAGVPVVEAAGGVAAGERLRELLGLEGLGLVLIEDTLEAQLPVALRERLERQPRPIVVTFPGPSWAAPTTAEAYVVELLRRAIGYRVRLQ